MERNGQEKDNPNKKRTTEKMELGNKTEREHVHPNDRTHRMIGPD